MQRKMRLPSRAAPSVEEAKNTTNFNQRYTAQHMKKKPPPRPPPPNFTKIKSKSSWTLNNQFDSMIDLSPPDSPKGFSVARNNRFGGSASSSFSSSTSSIASSKRSFEYESVNFENWGSNTTNVSTAAIQSTFYVNSKQSNISSLTIIRPLTTTTAAAKRNQPIKPKEQRDNSPPMPTVPPPSPPKEFTDVTVPYGIALYDYAATHKDDLSFKVDDVIFLIRRVNSEWLYGRMEDREGMFPNNYISIQVPLPDDDRLVTALYEFSPQATGDLSLQPGQIILVTGRASANWLIGESNGLSGQFPANYVDRIPTTV